VALQTPPLVITLLIMARTVQASSSTIEGSEMVPLEEITLCAAPELLFDGPMDVPVSIEAVARMVKEHLSLREKDHEGADPCVCC
jgi:hypothetical protein